MDKTLNQLKTELEEIATKHKQLESFFFGDFVDAISGDSVNYRLMCVTLQPATMGDNFVEVKVIITICDKYNSDSLRQINEIHSDCLSICNDIKIIFRQWRFKDFMDIDGDISTNPFINRGHDVTAGWTMTATANIYSDDNWCAIPMDNYDFKNDV